MPEPSPLVPRKNNVVAKDLHKIFGKVQALRGLSFSVQEGEILGLLGPNGAGKTTAIHILLGMLRPTSGEATVLGHSPFTEKYKIYPRINFSSAYVQLPFNIKAAKNLKIYAKLYGVSQADEKVKALMDSFQISHLADKLTGSLSSGEQTRLNLCKSLLNDPEVLFLDEPTASLDPDMADRVREALLDMHKKTKLSIVYTSHNMAEVENLCDRVFFLHNGRKVVEGTPEEVRGHFQQESLEKVFIHLARGGDLPPHLAAQVQ